MNTQTVNLSRIEFGELHLGDISKRNLEQVHKTSWASAGPLVKKFEEEWGKLFDYKYNYAVSSGTDACINMCLAVRALAPYKTEVIVPALSFIATSNAVRAAGLTPVWVDINRETLNIDPNKIEAAITDKTAAVMVVHTMGRPCDMKKIKDICHGKDIYLLEDCCEAHGAMVQGDYVGTFGHAAAFSFYVAHLVCAGEGGMVSTNFAAVGDMIKSTRSHGRKDGNLYFDFPHYGLNSKMNDLEAAVGLEGIENFSLTFVKRHNNMKDIMNGIKVSKDYAWFSEEDKGNINCPHGISITLKDPKYDIKGLQKHLDSYNIHWKRNFGCIPTQHGAFKEVGPKGFKHKLGDFPEAEYVGDYGIHIGCHQYLTDENIQRIIVAINSYFRGM